MDLLGPTFVAASSDNLSAWVVSSADQSLVEVNLGQQQQSIKINCPSQITGLDGLHGHAVFRLTGIINGRIIILDGDSKVPRVLPAPVLPLGTIPGAQP